MAYANVGIPKKWINALHADISLNKREAIATQKEYRDLLAASWRCRRIENSALISSNGAFSAQSLQYLSKEILENSEDLDKELADALLWCNDLQSTAINLEKRLAKIRGASILAREEKWAINLIKNIKLSLIAQRKLNGEIIKLARKAEKADFLNIKKIAKNIGAHLYQIAQYVLKLRELEAFTEKLEKQFAHHGKI